MRSCGFGDFLGIGKRESEMAGFEDQYIEIAGQSTRYWQAGEGGVPLVLLHGIASSVEDWEEVVQELSRDRSVYALDLLGCGLSAKPADGTFDPETMWRHVLGFLDAMSLTQVDVNGWSMGGRIALELSAAVPERVRKIVLTAPAGIGADTIINFRLASLPVVGELLTKPNAFGMKLLMKEALFDHSLITDELIEARLMMAKQPGAQQAFLKQLRSFVALGGFAVGPRQALVGKLGGITQPTLAIWGNQDKFVSIRHAEVLRDKLADFDLFPLEGCGHIPHAEHLTAYVEKLHRFLSEPA